MQREKRNEIGQAVFEQALEIWVSPEVKRRKQQLEGSERSTTLPVRAFQVLMQVGSENEVRLNEEVRIVARGKLEGEFEAGQEIFARDVQDIEEFELTAEDENAAHITAIRVDDFWYIGFDFRYNAGLAEKHLEAAEEFLRSAKGAHESGDVRPFVDCAFSGVELLAKARLFLRPDEKLLNHKIGHNYLKSRFNQYFGRGRNADEEYKELLNELAELRREVRYLRDTLVDETVTTFDDVDADEILETVERFRKWVEDSIPGRHEIVDPENDS